MPEDINKFLGGMNTDSHPSNQPEHTTRSMLNFVPLSTNGNLYSVSNEKGTLLYDNLAFPPNFQVIGYSVLNNDIIVVIATPTGQSQVGVINDGNNHTTYGKYLPIVPSDGVGGVPINNTEMGFNPLHPVDCKSRKLINGHRMLYFTDNNKPFGAIDLDNPPIVGAVSDAIKLVYNQTIPQVAVVGLIEGVNSTIKPGVVQFVTRYVTESGGTTVFGIPSDPYPVTPEFKSDGPSNYKGGDYVDGAVSKNILLEFTNVDTQFTELEVVAVYYEGSQSIIKASIVAQLPITGDTLSYTYTGPSTEAETTITAEEITQTPVSYTVAKCIEQKDNTLFLSNLRSRQVDNDVLQGIANSVEVGYSIDEVQYAGRGGVDGITPLAFIPVVAPFVTSTESIVLRMSEEIDSTTGATLATYDLLRDGTPGSGTVTITNASLIGDGDTIAVSATGAQAAVTFTARTTPTLDNEFEIVIGDNDATADNLATAINDSLTVDDYFAYTDGANLVNVVWNIVDLDANSVTVTLSGAGITKVDPSGASSASSTVAAVTASSSGTEAVIGFGVPIITTDQLIVAGLANSDLDETYSTGTLSGLSITLEDSDPSSVVLETGFTDYIEESLTMSSKGYRRGEVYSLGYNLLFKDGSTSSTYHIPGNVDWVPDDSFDGNSSGTPDIQEGNKFEPLGGDAWPYFSQTAISKKPLGTYVSTLEYPLNQNYPGDLAGDDTSEQGPDVSSRRLVRHHYMPELKNEPHFRVSNGITFIRILGLEFTFTESIPTDILADVAEIVFVRERRDKSENKSVFAQGFHNRMYVAADAFERDGTVDGPSIAGGTTFLNARNGYCAMEIPGFDNLYSYQYVNAEFKRGSQNASSRGGLVFPNHVSPVYTGTYSDGEKQATAILQQQVMFHSPETDFFKGSLLNEDVLTGAVYSPELQMTGKYVRANYSSGAYGGKSLSTYAHGDFGGDFNAYDLSLTATERNITVGRYARNSQYRLSALDPTEPGMKTSTRWSTSGLEIRLDGNVTANNTALWKFYDLGLNETVYDLGGTASSYTGAEILTNAGASTLTGDVARHLYNIKKVQLSQYSQIGVGEYISIARKPATSGGAFVTQYNSVFGGDTFITKYAYMTGALTPYFPLRGQGDEVCRPDYTTSSRVGGYTHVDGITIGGSTGGGPGKAAGHDVRTLNYYFVESSINTYYRRDDGDDAQSYYPDTLNVSALMNDFLPYFDNVSTYNYQYSYENALRKYYPRGSTQQTISSFETRTIYSETAASDDTLDSYRSFLQSNYYDLPSNTGPIWNTFVEYNKLFLHTPRSCWQTFAEPSATLKGGNITDVVLGTGNLFARPSQEMLTTEGGYAGTLSQFGGAHTQIGYVFPDMLQGKVFVLAMGKGGPHLKEISAEGLQSFFHKNLPEGVIATNGVLDTSLIKTETAYQIDNPFIGIGINSSYDYKLRRVIMVKHGDFTISYSTVTNNWFSFHDYTPNVIIPYDNRLFFMRNKDSLGNITSDMWEMNLGQAGSFFGTTYNSELEYVSAKGNQNNTYQNLIISSDSSDANGLKIKEDNFVSLHVYTDRLNSGLYNIIHGNSFDPTENEGEILIKYRNDEYRMSIPRDSVLDNSGDIFDPDNIYIPQGGNVAVDEDSGFRERIKGDYAHFEFVYDNTLDREFVLNYINTIFNNNIR